MRIKIVVGGGRLGEIGKWEPGGRVKLLVGGRKQEVEGGMFYPGVSPWIRKVDRDMDQKLFSGIFRGF